MTSPLETVNDCLLSVKFTLGGLRCGKTFKALELLDEAFVEELDSITKLLDDSRSLLIAYIETMRNDRREKKQRYKENKAKRNPYPKHPRKFVSEMDELSDLFAKCQI